MSAETVLPPEGPAGPDEQQEESSLLLDISQDTCQNDTKESDTTELSRTLSSQEHCADGQGNGMGESQTHSEPVRVQPQSSGLLQLPSEGESKQLHNGLHPGLSNGHRTTRGLTQPAAPSASSSETRKHPPPVSQRMQKKLRSSLSVNSDSSRKSKGSSTGSNKPGSSPEDCCVHCILACLFCEFLTLCNMVVAQASCGACTSEACCCCCCADDLGDDCNCPCDMDCGIMDACCESSDCLEICMECCGICFPT
ncbi:myoD family inhibitor domain-containing protein [Trichomycterus rosablanca]|uniref:myoD family inhibitor domain-containing protein n=1 Tax=Trichomycterus rosablanca TaxID=2290929 RepID=UPI002F35E7B1